MCQDREQRHRHYICTESCGKFPFFLLEHLGGSSRALVLCRSSHLLSVILYILSCKLALGSLAKMVIKCWVWPLLNLPELLQEPMVNFKTPDPAGDEDILERQLLTKGHRNSVMPQIIPCPGSTHFPVILANQAALQKGSSMSLYMLQKKSDLL